MSIIIFIAVLFALVLVHEWGHFIVAKKTGMRVDEFGIGFPPRVFSIMKKGTLYSINLLPIGGFVKIFGEDAVLGEDEPTTQGSFTSKSKWAQSAVLVAGVTMNILFAWVLFTLALGIGVQTAVEESNATANAKMVVGSVIAGTPAEKARMPEGAIVTGVVGGKGDVLEKVVPSAFSSFAAAHGNEVLSITYTLGKNSSVIKITPERGVIKDEPDRAAIGIQLMLVDVVSESVPHALTKGFMLTVTSLRDVAVGMYGLIKDAVMLRADLSHVAGPVGIVGLVGQASALGITSLLMFTAFISLNLAVINLLPFPALDGGRLLFVVIEAIKRSPINPKYVMVLNTAGFVLLMILMVAITWHDVAKMF